MKIGLLTRNPRAWCSARIIEAMIGKKIEPIPFSFSNISAHVAFKPKITIHNTVDLLRELKALIVRPIGRGSLDEVIFRLDYLHRMERLGLPIVNDPSSIEKAVDKYYALSLLEEDGINVPKTVVTENPEIAEKAFEELGGDVVIKPIFGSRGIGVTRISDFEVARRIFRALTFQHNVLYLQEFIPHGRRDIRAFVIGEKVIAAMYRVSENWKTNVSQGAKTIPLSPSSEIEEIAVRAANSVGCKIAGVDIIEGDEGYFVNEINSQPGFKGLQSTTNVNIASEIVEYVLTTFCKNK